MDVKMINACETSVFGSKWFEKYVLVRKHPEHFIKRAFAREEDFYLNILKDLCSESVDKQCKIHLLLFLQDNSSLLLPTSDKVESTVGSLKSFYDEMQNSEDQRLLKSQILITMTTVLLSHEGEDDFLFTLLYQVKDLLLEVITKQHTVDAVLCATACKCLEEIEMFFPNTLRANLGQIWESCQHECSPAFQCYASLLSLTVKNTVISEAKQITNLEASDDIKTVNIHSERHPTTPVSSELEVFPVVMYILDNLSLMTSASVHHIMRYLINIVKFSHELLPITFKTWAPRLMLTSDVPLFHVAFDMLRIFGSELFTIQEEQALHQQLLLCATHPGLSVSQRLLYLDWIQSSLKNRKLPSHNMSYRNLSSFLPGPYDGLDIQEKKLKILAYCTSSENHSDSLMAWLASLKKTVMRNAGVRAFSSLFRTLYFYYSFHKDVGLKSRIFRFMLDLIITSPHLIPHLLDFLESIKTNDPKSLFVEESLMALVKHIINLSATDAVKNFTDYLLVLEKAAGESADVCKPKKVLWFLKKLMSYKEIYEKGDWFLGNNILSVCRSLLESQNIEFLYTDLGEVLYTIMMDFEDVDVKIRARLYYAALTSLPSSKVKQLLKHHSEIKEPIHSLTSFVTDRSSAFHCRRKIHHLEHCVLKLTRIAKKIIPVDNHHTTWNDYKFTEDDFNSYRIFISSQFHPALQIPLLLQLTQDTENKFQTVYGVVVYVRSDPPCTKLNDIQVPFLTVVEPKFANDYKISLEIWPQKPMPLTINFRAEFTCEDAQSFTSPLPSITLEFQDLFLPLPIILHSTVPEIMWQRALFNYLWEKFTDETSKGINETTCQKSVHRVEISVSDLSSFVERNFKAFLLPFGEDNIFDVGVFLPSSCHLLMKIKLLNEAPLISILTDNFYILPLVNIYLKTLEKT